MSDTELLEICINEKVYLEAKVENLQRSLQDLIDREDHPDNTTVYWVHSKFGLTTAGTWAKYVLLTAMTDHNTLVVADALESACKEG